MQQVSFGKKGGDGDGGRTEITRYSRGRLTEFLLEMVMVVELDRQIQLGQVEASQSKEIVHLQTRVPTEKHHR